MLLFVLGKFIVKENREGMRYNSTDCLCEEARIVQSPIRAPLNSRKAEFPS